MNNTHLSAKNLIVKSSLILDPTQLLPLEQALFLTQEKLQTFTSEPDFGQKMAIAFGEGANVDSLKTAWLAGDFSIFSEIEIRHAADINGANGAFAAATNKIYISQEFIINHHGDVGAIARVILEEFGHWVDTQINTTDAPGDEGDIFARLVLGDTLAESELTALKQENDVATIVVDGQTVKIEQANIQNNPSPFYTYQIIAKTGDLGITTIQPETSINDSGVVAFIAQGAPQTWLGVEVSKDSIYAGDGESNSLKNISPNIIASTFLNSQYALTNPSRWFDQFSSTTISPGIQINNSNEILVRRIEQVNGPGVITNVLLVDPSNGQAVGGIPQVPYIPKPYTFIEKWDANSINSVQPLVQGVGPIVLTSAILPVPTVFKGDFDIVDSNPSINNDGDIVFTARNVSSSGTTRYLGDITSSGNFQIPYSGNPPTFWMADNDTFVLNFNNQITVRNPVFNSLGLIAGASNGFNTVGKNPRISDDGNVVAFYGELNNTGAAILSTNPGAGIFAAINTESSWKIQRISGISGNGYLDPGELFNDPNGNNQFDSQGTDINGNGIIEQSEKEVDQGLFKSFDPNAPVGVNSYFDSAFTYNIAYIGLDNADKKGIYSSLISELPQAQVEVFSSTSIVRVGEIIPNSSAIIEDLTIYEPVNNRGQVSFWADTNAGEVVGVANPSGIIIEDTWGSVQDGTITFKIRLTNPLTNDLTLDYLTLDSSANSTGIGNDKKDYITKTGQVTIKAGTTEAEIKISILDNEGQLTDEQFEFFARNTAYKDWLKNGKTAKRADIDAVSDKPDSIKDIGYRVDDFFSDPSTGFDAVGLTSTEKFFLVLSSSNTGQFEFVKEQPSELNFLQKLEEDLGVDKNSLGEDQDSKYYQDTSDVLNQFLSLSNPNSWTFATGTIYDKNRSPVLAVRGTEPPSILDWFDNSNPNGVGFEQFTNNFGTISNWLQKESQPKQDQNNNPLLNFKPHITGHSLGGALTQWIAGEYLTTTDTSFALGDLVAFNTPAISETGANKIDLSRVDSITLNIMSSDLVSMAGDDYLSGSTVNLFNYFSFPQSAFDAITIVGAHGSPMYLPETSSYTKPSSLTKKQISSSQASDFFFTYFPDPDYFALVTAVTAVTNIAAFLPIPNPFGIPLSLVGPALIFRGTTEFGRKNLGTTIRDVLETIETTPSAIQFGINAYNSAVNYTGATWQTLKDQALSFLQIFESSTQTIVSSSTGSGELESAILLAQNQLTQFANSAKFDTDMVTAFGSQLDTQTANILKQQWLTSDFSNLPTIEIVPSAKIGGNSGAFTALREIYISEDLLTQNANNLDAIVNVLLEEIGHWVDTQVNQFDASGDEGEIFASLAQGITLTPQQLDTLRNENDFVTLSLEQPSSFDENVIDNFWKAINFFSPEAWEALGVYPDEAWIAMRGWGKTGWSAVSQWTPENWNASKQWTPAQWQATEKFTENDWDNMFQQSTNTPPQAVNDTITTNEDTPLIINVLANDSDVDGNPLTLSLATLPTNGNAIINDNGTPTDPTDDFITYTPNLNFNGTDTFTYIVSDGTDSATASVTVTVNPVNDAPTLVNTIASQTANEDTAFTFIIPENTYTDIDANDSLRYSATLENGSTLPSWLTFAASTRTLSGTPSNADVGTLNIKVTATDNSGASISDIFALSVANVNDAPTLNKAIANQTILEDTTFNLTFDANTFNDIDAGDSLSYNATLANGNPLPTWLNFNAATRTFSGTPTNSDVGTLSLKLTATDIAGASSEDIFDLQIINVNDAPIAANDTATTNQNTPLTLPVTNLLANDSDIDGNPLSITAVSNATNGSVVFNTKQGNVVFTPVLNFSGTASFNYTVTDGNGGTSTATVAITVNPSSQPNEITGTSGRDTLTGTSNSDRIIGLQGADTLTGGGGNDQFVYTNIRDRGDTITDFEVGKDNIVFTELLDSLVTGGYNGTNAIADGYVKVVQGNSASNFSVQIDADGPTGNDIFRPFITVNLAGTGTFNNPSNFVF